MTEGKTYDLVVIGTGTAAQVTSFRVRAAGWSVAVIDHLPFGGTCALRGCDPKKMLIGGAEVIDMTRRMRGRGVTGELAINWPDLMAFKRTFTDPIPQKQEHRYAAQSIDTFHGKARFTGPDTIEVAGQTIQARHVLIATGARPVALTFPGAEHLIASDNFLELPKLPARIVMVGGGYIAAEFSHIAARAGAKVTVLQRAERMLTQFDPDLVVHAAGRVPDLDALNLSAAGIAVENGHLVLNEFLQSASNLAVYEAGDAAAKGRPLTPVSSHDGKVVAGNLLEGNRHRPDYRGVPSVAFTLPPIAAVGFGRSRSPRGGTKISDQPREGSGLVYGPPRRRDGLRFQNACRKRHRPHADEVINVLGLAIRHGLTAADIKQTMFAYPTAASDVGYML